MHHPFHGLITALITPFKNNTIDLESLKKLLDHQKQCGVKAVVIAGSTGEMPTLSPEEYKILIENTLKFANGINVIVGSSSNNTETAVSRAICAEKKGAKAIMSTVPYYNRPTQEGLYLHFKAIHDATNIPIMLYTIPIRTGTDLADETVFRLAELPRIVAMKDSGSDIERTLRISAKLPNFAILAGDDSVASAFYAQGASGLVSVTSNILPAEMSEVCKLLSDNNFREALLLQQKLWPLYNAMFIETNPVPVKYAASLLGLCSSDVRLPLCSLRDDNKDIVKKALKSFLR